MRKKTAPQTHAHRTASSSPDSKLIAQGQNASQSAATQSALGNRSHRTHIRLRVVGTAGGSRLQPNGLGASLGRAT
jgi:hypothetical protein